MAIRIKLVKDNRDGSKTNGKYIVRKVKMGILSTREIAAEIQRNVSVKTSDVVAVLMELSEVMKIKMQEGYTCRLDGIGLFDINPVCMYLPLEAWKNRIDAGITGYHTRFREEVIKGHKPFGTKRQNQGGDMNGNGVFQAINYQSPEVPDGESGSGGNG